MLLRCVHCTHAIPLYKLLLTAIYATCALCTATMKCETRNAQCERVGGGHPSAGVSVRWGWDGWGKPALPGGSNRLHRTPAIRSQFIKGGEREAQTGATVSTTLLLLTIVPQYHSSLLALLSRFAGVYIDLSRRGCIMETKCKGWRVSLTLASTAGISL